MSFPAELVADEGAAAASLSDFFRSPEFMAAEGVTHSLHIGDAITLPLLVRPIPGSELLDAISPYGYPGANAGASVDPADVDWSGAGLVSGFVRDRIGPDPFLAGATERSRVQVHDPAAERRVRPRLAEQIRAAERAGLVVEAIPGPDSAPEQRASFLRAYDETMRRAEAAERYFYPAAYFEAILAFERSWLVLASQESEIVAGAIAALSDGVLHYYLGGTADAHLDASPFKNVVVRMMDLADELEAPLNLGGGVEAGDGLESFKRGFANAELPFFTHELVLDEPEYERLSAGVDAGGFFPAYRAES
jgi:hypothetical protein